MKKKIRREMGEERKRMLEEFDQKAQGLFGFLERTQLRYVEVHIDAVKECLAEVRKRLERDDFLGCVMKFPAPKQLRSARVESPGVYRDMTTIGCVDCTSPKSGDVGYRVTSIWPQKTDKVIFYHGFGWLTDEERAKLRQKEPKLAP